MNVQLVFKRIGMFIAWIVTLLICWSTAYFLTDQVQSRTNWELSDYRFVLLSNAIGVFLLMGLISLVGLILRPRHRRGFQVLVDAMRRMAEGDFNISIRRQESHPGFDELVDSINHMATELNQLEQMRQEFISNVSHEIQSPLTSISGFARALQDMELTPEERSHYLTIIEMESKRLSRMSDHLLKLTSLESEHHPFELKSYRLDKQLRSVLLSTEPLWSGNELEIDVELDEIVVQADEELLSQVWLNLLHNSIKFTPKGGSITVRLEPVGDKVAASFTDTGIGIKAEDCEQIFSRFFKADKSRNSALGGSGLGLAIVSKIIDMHHGQIRVESKLGEGSAFHVLLPLRQPESAPETRERG